MTDEKKPVTQDPLDLAAEIIGIAVDIGEASADEPDEVGDAIKSADIRGKGEGSNGREAVLSLENDKLRQAIAIAGPIVKRHRATAHAAAEWLSAARDRGVELERQLVAAEAQAAKLRRWLKVAITVLSTIAAILGAV